MNSKIMQNLNNNQMYVTKRNGQKETIYFDKITTRIANLIEEDELNKINPIMIAQKVVASIYPGITTEILDLESAKICANLATTHPLYNNLAARILISNLQKKLKNTFSDKMKIIQEMGIKNGKELLDTKFYNYVQENADELNKIIDYKRDFNYDFFGFKTLEKSYLLKNIKTGEICESPQDMIMRVATFLNMGNLELIKKSYDIMSQGNYTHASPTLFNSGLKRSQLASCFLVGTEDSISGITNTIAKLSQISKWGGGIGLHVSNIRAKGSLIRGTNAESGGLVPMLRVYNELARYVNQGRRKGSFAIYLEPHHPDLLDFLELRKNFGVEEKRTRDLFLALWVSDLFMKQVQADKDWYFMCPDECPGLELNYGEKYEKLYWKYVEEEKYKFKKSAREVMKAILDSQLETGMPYMAFKDSVNRKSNQKNLGTIRSSNLCIEIMEYSDNKEFGTCNLASIAVNKFLEEFKQEERFIIYTKENCKYCRWAKNFMKYKNYNFEEIDDTDGILVNSLPQLKQVEKITFPQIFYGNKLVGGFDQLINFTKDTYNFNKLYETAYLVTINLNKVIDLNYYPCVETERSNMKHRPIGMGIQGVADALVRLRIPFDSNESLDFNTNMMETIYLAGITASNDLAKERYEDMKKLKEFIIANQIELPEEFYSSEFKIIDEEMNNLYHKLRPTKDEINKLTYAYGAYSSFEGSPFSEGLFQFDLWGHIPKNKGKWDMLAKSVKKYGTRNSLITALMPTASTSQILGNNECFEFFTSNIYTRRTLAGDFPIINKYLVEDLVALGIWNNDVKDLIIADNGSVQKLQNVPKFIKDLYKIMWEIKQVWVLKNANARNPFVDQSQSMNIYMPVPNSKNLYSSHFWGWKKGFKTGLYYLRSKPSANAIKFTIDPKLMNKVNAVEEEDCVMCSA